ncbi:alkyl/aryl-sulfatase [Nocardia tengchongensis]|uniref:alkyl/aryl-sulfatase n=1 Tax=Nocardia tengchongensis TaxID=2055889 RepID=UPI003677EDE4
MTDSVDPSAHIRALHEQLLTALPFADTTDFADVAEGFIAAPATGTITAADGNVVWDNDAYGFLTGECPPSVNPSLWRQAGLSARQGLYRVTESVYQIRGFDISNMTLIEGDTGVVIIDPLTVSETAAAGLALYREHRGDRPVTGVIYTHSHADHFGGVLGVTTVADVEAGKLPIIAPEGFAEHAVAENVFAGTAMARRAAYQFGSALPRGVRGTVGTGLGTYIPTGSFSLVPPTVDVTVTGQQEIVDGVRIVFQLTPGTEAPAEMNIYLPDRRALCMAENAIHTMHNILTPRGALVRDAHIWAKYLTEAVRDYARHSDVVFSSHLWPTWGTERVVEFIELQRDMYGYLHDQTLRRLNQGEVGTEIAEDFPLPPALENTWHTRGYYGTISHNVKAVYQRYMGWYDGNPAHLWEHPPVASARRHVELGGGRDAMLVKARAAYDEGDYRWAAQILNYLIFADDTDTAPRDLQAATFEQLAYGAEAATWRNNFLSGAYELRNGTFGTPTTSTASPTLLNGLSVEQVFDGMALLVNGPKAWSLRSTIDWRITDQNRVHRVELRNGLLVHYDHTDEDLPAADVTFALTHPTLIRVLLAGDDFAAAATSGDIEITGDPGKLVELVSVLDELDRNFAIVTP